MAAVNDLIIQKDKTGIAEDAVSIVVPDATVYLPLEELIDFDQELERLTKPVSPKRSPGRKAC